MALCISQITLRERDESVITNILWPFQRQRERDWEPGALENKSSTVEEKNGRESVLRGYKPPKDGMRGWSNNTAVGRLPCIRPTI